VTAPQTRPSAGTWVLAGLSAAAHLAVGVFYLASRLVAPLWAVIAFATWYAVLTVGERLLDWTA
jgi:hypothetical protein